MLGGYLRAICLPLGGAPLRMWERLGCRQARDLKGFPDYRTLLGRPGTALLELTPAQKDLVPLPAVSEGNLARQREPGLRAISGARTGLRSALRLALRLSCSWAEKRAYPTRMALAEAGMSKHSTSL